MIPLWESLIHGSSAPYNAKVNAKHLDDSPSNRIASLRCSHCDSYIIIPFSCSYWMQIIIVFASTDESIKGSFDCLCSNVQPLWNIRHAADLYDQ
mmetsp:Transcript_126712/g.370272  ORF Transcript_126712/g.370272 Transcript_126712/m.370272 type:complete len:95 (+) Transcript_126712:645-929(+)